ncbi:hypothetical protein [Streptomyces sp. LBL]|uniref:hypothetical protein n=1 Tax=Streptomyces sp. LBL TaxID=2940562 RepID=UPI002475B1BC|nr:hypothetical protein [Streptomyces sp. LBL]
MDRFGLYADRFGLQLTLVLFLSVVVIVVTFSGVWYSRWSAGKSLIIGLAFTAHSLCFLGIGW